MENLRWILIFAGVAILVLLYLSGRQPKAARRKGETLNRNSGRDSGRSASKGQAPVDPLLSEDAFSDPLDDFGDSGGASGGVSGGASGVTSGEFDEIDDLMERPGGQSPARKKRASSEAETTGGFGGISSTFGALGSKFTSKRSSSSSESDSASNQAQATKIVTLHVVAPEGQLMNGAHLLEQFEQRGYHFGDMNIFHSMHEGQTVFSVAKLVKPGSFDIRDMDSFQTPGISLILQLPGPVAADVAFEVLLSEAHEIGNALGATVLDADRSTLSKQTVQHMREGINEYLHKQKYSSGIPS